MIVPVALVILLIAIGITRLPLLAKSSVGVRQFQQSHFAAAERKSQSIIFARE